MMGTTKCWSFSDLISLGDLQGLLLYVHYTQVCSTLYLWFVQHDSPWVRKQWGLIDQLWE